MNESQIGLRAEIKEWEKIDLNNFSIILSDVDPEKPMPNSVWTDSLCNKLDSRLAIYT